MRKCLLCDTYFKPKHKKHLYCKNSHDHPCPICQKICHHSNQRQDRCCSVACRLKKAEQTNLERYGATNPACKGTKVREQIERTCLELYGGISPLHNKEIKDKTVQTIIERYGVDCPLKNKEIKDKQQTTILERYKVSEVSQRHIKHFEEWCHLMKFLNTHQLEYTLDDLANYFNVNTNNLKRKLLSLTDDYRQYVIVDDSIYDSTLEEEIVTYLQDIKFCDNDFVLHDRQLIKPKELDIVSYSHQIAIEINGEFWHSDQHLLKQRGQTAKEVHNEKIALCKSQGIQLLYLWEKDWQQHTQIIKNALANKDFNHAIFKRTYSILD